MAVHCDRSRGAMGHSASRACFRCRGSGREAVKPGDGSGEPPAPGRNGERDFHGETRPNATHASTTDAEAKPYRKSPGTAARLCFMGHLLMENRHGMVVDARLSEANGTAERDTAMAMVGDLRGRHPITLGADKADDVASFIASLRDLRVTPHVAQNTTNRRSAIDGRTTRHPGYEISQRLRKRIEEPFGWLRPSATCARPGTRAWPASAGPSPSPWPPTISSACQS
jgi:hypothetical protein